MTQGDQRILDASKPGRNQPCPCGSGKRYKQCCGALIDEPGSTLNECNVSGGNTFVALMNRALAAQQAEHLDEAERYYRSALSLNPESFDALHMLGVVHLQMGDAEEATRLLMSALPFMSTAYPPFFYNLGRCLVSVIRQRKLAGDVAVDGTGKAYLGFFRRNNLPPLPSQLPLVSIVIRLSHNSHHAERTLTSVFEQSYPNIEIIIVSNGAQDCRAEAVVKILESCPFPHRFIRENGLENAALLNAAVAGASGRYVGLVGMDDEYSTEHVDCMVRMLDGANARWGFSNVRFVDEASSRISYGLNEAVDARMREFDAMYSCHSVIDVFQEQNPVFCSGNLFFERDLWREVGGFLPDCKSGEWAFCLMAGLRAEPVFLDEPAYGHRIPGMGDCMETEVILGEEEYAMLERWHHQIDTLVNVPYPALRDVRGRSWHRRLARLNRGAHLMRHTELLRYAVLLGFESAPAS